MKATNNNDTFMKIFTSLLSTFYYGKEEKFNE